MIQAVWGENDVIKGFDNLLSPLNNFVRAHSISPIYYILLQAKRFSDPLHRRLKLPELIL